MADDDGQQRPGSGPAAWSPGITPRLALAAAVFSFVVALIGLTAGSAIITAVFALAGIAWLWRAHGAQRARRERG